MLNSLFLLLVFDCFKIFLNNAKTFCIITQSLNSFVSELNFMPLLAIWCSYAPINLEATSITLFTGILNLSGNLSNYFGSLLTFLIGVN